MDNHTCPFLGTLDETYNRGPHVDYPSFENRCLAIDEYGEDEACVVMLSDQATFCLSSGYALCPRFQAAQEAGAPRTSRKPKPARRKAGAGLTSDWLQSSLDELDQDLDDDDDTTLNRRLWGWIGAVLIFLMVFICGGSFAVFVGWQAVSSSLVPAAAPEVDRLAALPAVLTQQPLVLVVTLTPASDTPPTATPGAVIAAPTQSGNFAFPAAVTPTPGDNNSTSNNDGTAGSGVIVVNPNVAPPTPTLPPAPIATPATAPPVVDINAVVPEAPTRRPTPTFEIPTSTPLPAEPTPTVTPTLGPSVVIFRSDAGRLMADECTVVRWNVQNVREVYYEGIGVSGQGSREECLDDEESETYTLMVVLGTGLTEIYTTTVRLIEPTPTPTFTPTWTPFPVFTPTWTPEPPPVTPTPRITYGVDLLLSGGSQQRCAAGATCRVGVTVTNLGNEVDNLTVQIVGAGGWSSQLCRLDGVCAAGALTIYNVGPGTAGTMNLVVEVPAEATGQSQGYTLEAASGNSGGAVRSDAVLVDIQVE